MYVQVNSWVANKLSYLSIYPIYMDIDFTSKTRMLLARNCLSFTYSSTAHLYILYFFL